MTSKKDSVPAYVPQAPAVEEPSRNDLLNRYGFGPQDETPEEREMREWEEEQARKLEASHAAPKPLSGRASTVAPPELGSVARVDDADEGDGGLEAAGVARPPAHADEHGFVPIPEYRPPQSDDPRERLNHYLRGIGQVEYAAKSNEQRVQQQRLLVLGEYIQAMKEERAWEAGGYNTLGDLLFEHFGIRKDYANKVVRAVPVVRALEQVTTMDLKERQLRVLVPVQANHGDDAVRKVWEEAARRGKLTEKTLEQAARFLGYGVPEPANARVTRSGVSRPRKEVNETDGRGSPPAGRSESSLAPRVTEVCASIREMRTRDEEQARLELKQLWTAVEELRRELGVELES